jgi:hypothetical protein
LGKSNAFDDEGGAGACNVSLSIISRLRPAAEVESGTGGREELDASEETGEARVAGGGPAGGFAGEEAVGPGAGERRLKEHRDLFLFLLLRPHLYRLRLCLSRRLDKPPGMAGPGES